MQSSSGKSHPTQKFSLLLNEHDKKDSSSAAAAADIPSAASPVINLNQLFKPVTVQPNPDDMNLGEEIAGKMNRQALLKKLNELYLAPSIKTLSKEHGMDDYLYHQVSGGSVSVDGQK
jgi:hypothetical protein